MTAVLDEHPVERILVLSLAGFGDAIMATPLCQSLRERFPEARIEALTMWQSSATVFHHLRVFDRVQAHNFLQAGYAQSLRRLGELRRRCFDVSILAYPANRGHYNLVARAIGARYRLGHDYRLGHPITYGRWLLTHRIEQLPEAHNVEQNLRLAPLLDAADERRPMSVGDLGAAWGPTVQAERRAHRGPWVGVHPGCSRIKHQDQRRWPIERYAEVINRLTHQVGAKCLVFLGPDDEALAAPLRQQAPEAEILLRQPIDQVTAWVRACDAFLCNDSSLGHLAAACGIPVASVVGPTNPAYTYPWQVPHRIVRLGLDCSPCYEVARQPLRCPVGRNFQCLRHIEPQPVVDACLQLLGAPRGQALRAEPVSLTRDGLPLRPGRNKREAVEPALT